MESEFSTKPNPSTTNPPSLKETESQFEMNLLASTLAHEIRNPLQTIRLQLDVAARGGSVTEALKVISENVKRLEAVVGRVQELSHTYVVNAEKINLRSLIESSLSSINFWLGASGILVRTHCQWEGEPLCDGDPELLQQVFLNIFMNAIQAMPKGGTLNIYLSEETEHAVIEISDTGEGFARESIKMLGTPFFTTKADGHGLGLAFCKTISLLHGGSIDFEGSSEGGAKVIVRIARQLARKEGGHHVQ
ncbi:MAG: kinC [Bacteriovoracaceae bacterium]|nr:kinC [Bacteriovoracaceae bacterium]